MPLRPYFCMEMIGRIGALLQKGPKIAPQRALFYGPSNSVLRAPFHYRVFFSLSTQRGWPLGLYLDAHYDLVCKWADFDRK